MRRSLTRPGGRTTDLHGHVAKVAEVEPGDAAKIYRLGREVGLREARAEIEAAYRNGVVAGAEQLAAADAAKALRDEYWKGYADAVQDLYGDVPPATPTPGAGEPATCPTHRVGLLPGGRSTSRRRPRREHLRLIHGGAKAEDR